jgi:hypothetical protein
MIIYSNYPSNDPNGVIPSLNSNRKEVLNWEEKLGSGILTFDVRQSIMVLSVGGHIVTFAENYFG